jgi:pimeloyl-ACP methyl ester carboxylesterase
MEAEPFTVAIPDEAIASLKDRLRRTTLAPDFANDDWRYGTNREYLERFIATWRDEYDWRATEREINSFANYRVDFDGVPIHFIHERGKGPNPVPVILTHGWPWSFWDFKESIRPLTDPAAFGGDPADACDVVVPSLPGFGFSTPLRVDGVSAWKATDLWARLMHEVLGYERFVAAGGDFGAIISAQLGQRFPELVQGVYLTMPSVGRAPAPAPATTPPPPQPTPLRMLLGLINGPTSRLKREDFAPDEAHWYDLLETRWVSALSHVAVQTTDPQTLAYALHDSPAGLAAWLIERRRSWSDNNGDVEDAFSRQFLMDLVSIYWFTESFFTTARWYWHTFRTTPPPASPRPREAQPPVGVAVSPADVVFTPRALVAANANLVHWTNHPRGGHFGPAEEPDLFVADLREFLRNVR